tara:strand:+ start:1377 stop:3074 length:1698 start_codon:yes stop_codon:yes gene_type:complete
LAKLTYYDFLIGSHELYNRYYDDWELALKSFYGGVEYRRGRYLKAYDIDTTTPSETIQTYSVDDNGHRNGSFSTQNVHSKSASANGGDGLNDNFYEEKLRNVPVFPYTRLYVSEYNSILFRSPPHRLLPEDPLVDQFLLDCDGEGNSANEFWSNVDTFTTVCGIVWVSCIKPADSEYALWQMHKPTDVTNWEYRYNTSGELILSKIVFRISSNPGVDIYRHITAETIDTVFVVTDDDFEIDIPEDAEYFEDEMDYFRISQPNELGYIPVRPVYQSSKIYNGVGHTPIFDIANIQRSIYGDMGEIYSAVSYGSHPVNVIDTDTADLNGGAINAEPGSIVRVNPSLSGQTPSYVYEFVAPPLDSITELRELIDQKIEKMNAVAMIRSDELIKASRSGAQLEQYDSKLEALIRKKATSLENAEYQMWKIWWDWQNKDMPSDITISYNRHYSKRGLEQEISEMQQLMDLYDNYRGRFTHKDVDLDQEYYVTSEEAQARAIELGGSGSHQYTEEDGTVLYMPFRSHEQLEAALLTDDVDSTQQDFDTDIKDRLQKRMMQIIESSSSENSL